MSADRAKKCTETSCRIPATTGGFCRLHYLRNWKEIVQERRAKAREKFQQYVDNLSEKHGDEYVGVLESDLGDEETMRKRLREFGFREELEEGEKNPFEASGVRDLLDDLGLGEDD